MRIFIGMFLMAFCLTELRIPFVAASGLAIAAGFFVDKVCDCINDVRREINKGKN